MVCLRSNTRKVKKLVMCKSLLQPCPFWKMACVRKFQSRIGDFGVTIASTCHHRYEQAVSSFLAGQPHGTGPGASPLAGRYPAGTRSPVIDAPSAAVTRLFCRNAFVRAARYRRRERVRTDGWLLRDRQPGTRKPAIEAAGPWPEKRRRLPRCQARTLPRSGPATRRSLCVRRQVVRHQDTGSVSSLHWSTFGGSYLL